MRMRAPVMLGREDELEFLDRTMHTARSGSGRAVFVVGEAGIGKSRLVRELVERARAANVTVIVGRGSSMGSMVPYRPIVEAMLSLTRIGRLPDPRDLGPYRGILGRFLPEWALDGDAAGDQSLVVLGEAILRLLAAAGCLFVVEDLHDCDPESLAIVEYLADNLAGQPAMLLATARPGPGRAADLVRAAGQRDSAALLPLRRLDADEVCAMVAGCLGVGCDSVPGEILAQLRRDSLGVPFIVEELLHDMVSSGALARGPGGWRASLRLSTGVPATLAASIVERVARLGPRGRQLLGVAALLGKRFPVAVVQLSVGIDDRELMEHLRAATVSQLVAPEHDDPRSYCFEHPLTAEALRADLAPLERVELSGRAARAIRQLFPELPGDWCQQTAVLLLDAGDPAGAAALFTEAGRRALADSAAVSAAALLERAEELYAGLGDPTAHAEVIDQLLLALAMAGRMDRAMHLIDTVAAPLAARLDGPCRAALHLRFASIADASGRQTDAAAQLTAARSALGEHPSDECLAPVDALAAAVALGLPGRSRVREAEHLARRAAAAAERAELPDALCRAMDTLGALTRGRDRAESAAAYDRARQVAKHHRLPMWESLATARLVTLDWLYDGTTASMEAAHRHALRTGYIELACSLDTLLAFHRVLCAQFVEAADHLAHCRADAARLRLGQMSQYLTMEAAVLAAHRGDRAGMERELAEFRATGGYQAQCAPLAIGMAGAFCSLLEEDPERAEADLRQVLEYESRNPTVFHLAGPHGLQVLLAVLAGRLDRARFDAVATRAPARMRWNQQFVLLAEAVLLGREQLPDRATAAFERAQDVAEPYVMTRHLGARLAAPAAFADGWGDPAAWLRDAEDYFYQAGVHVVAGACRRLLRRAGRTVPARRSGLDRVPGPLRAVGVTLREYEVLLLLTERRPNKEIAQRMQLSSRTVEKYVANLLSKTGQPDRHHLSHYASTLCPSPASSTR